MRGLFKGIGPRVDWITVGGYVFFGAYEQAERLLWASGGWDENPNRRWARGGQEHAGGRITRGRGVVGVLSSRSRRCFSLVLVLPWVPEGECGIILVLCWLVVD